MLIMKEVAHIVSTIFSSGISSGIGASHENGRVTSPLGLSQREELGKLQHVVQELMVDGNFTYTSYYLQVFQRSTHKHVCYRHRSRYSRPFLCNWPQESGS